MLEKIYGNMSAAHLKLRNWDRAVQTADQCLKKNENNLKALFRKGKALGEQGFWEKAEPILQDCLKRNPAGVYTRSDSSSPRDKVLINGAEAPMINSELARLRAMDQEREKAARKKLKGMSLFLTPDDSL
jgi:tetratricopeptide (TPR) repeat protein